MQRSLHRLGQLTVANYKTKVSIEALREVDGLDPANFGFTRPECCGPTLPSQLRGSFTVVDHVVVNTATLKPSEWRGRGENATTYRALEKRLRAEAPDINIAIFHSLSFPDGCALRFRHGSTAAGDLQMLQYGMLQKGELLPWCDAADVPVDRSGEYFVFICAHKARDARCGYCGIVLVDLLQQRLTEMPELKGKVHALPCSHISGHVYAGNVLLYSRHGGICFGCVTPSDIDTLVAMIQKDDGVIPPTLQDRVRGHMRRPSEAIPTP